MEPTTLARRVGLYTCLAGGGAIALTGLFAGAIRPYAISGFVAVGVVLIGWGLVDPSAPKTGGIRLVDDPEGGDTRGLRPARKPSLYMAAGLVLFGVVALVAGY